MNSRAPEDGFMVLVKSSTFFTIESEGHLPIIIFLVFGLSANSDSRIFVNFIPRNFGVSKLFSTF